MKSLAALIIATTAALSASAMKADQQEAIAANLANAVKKGATLGDDCSFADQKIVGNCKVENTLCMVDPLISIRMVACVEGLCVQSDAFKNRTSAQEQAYDMLFSGGSKWGGPAACIVERFSCFITNVTIPNAAGNDCYIQHNVCDMRDDWESLQAVSCTKASPNDTRGDANSICAFSEVYKRNDDRANATSYAIADAQAKLLARNPACGAPPALKN